MARGMRTFFPMPELSSPKLSLVPPVAPATDGPTDGSLDAVSQRLASLLGSGGTGLLDPSGHELIFETSLEPRLLDRAESPPVQAWAVDGGQCLVADARCLQVFATRSARVCWSGGRSVVEEAGDLQVWLLGPGQSEGIRRQLGAPVTDDCVIDVNLLREWGEWSEASACVDEALPGALILVDGDLAPDWRISPDWLAGLLDRADDRSVTLIGVTKHTALSWGGAPLLGVLERMAEENLGPRSMWWVPVARTEPSVGPGTQVVVARLDPDARFAFRIDLPGYVDPALALPVLGALCDDAGFPGYPYPLSTADRLAACPTWVREDLRHRIDDRLDRAGITPEVRERAFADRHRLMERY